MTVVWTLEGFEMVGRLTTGEVVAKITTIPMVRVKRVKVGLELPSGYGCTLSDKDAWVSGIKFSDMRAHCPKAKEWCERMVELLYIEAE